MFLVIVIPLLGPKEEGGPPNLQSKESFTFERMCCSSPEGDSLAKAGGLRTMGFCPCLGLLCPDTAIRLLKLADNTRIRTTQICCACENSDCPMS